MPRLMYASPLGFRTRRISFTADSLWSAMEHSSPLARTKSTDPSYDKLDTWDSNPF